MQTNAETMTKRLQQALEKSTKAWEGWVKRGEDVNNPPQNVESRKCMDCGIWDLKSTCEECDKLFKKSVDKRLNNVV